MPLRNIYLMPKECLKSLQPFSRNAILGDFFRPAPDGFSVVFDHLFSRRMKTAELSPVKIGTVMHTTTTHLSVFVGPKKSSCGPRNSLLCTKQSTQKTPKTHYGAVTTPTDLLRLHGISPSTLTPAQAIGVRGFQDENQPSGHKTRNGNQFHPCHHFLQNLPDHNRTITYSQNPCPLDGSRL